MTRRSVSDPDNNEGTDVSSLKSIWKLIEDKPDKLQWPRVTLQQVPLTRVIFVIPGLKVEEESVVTRCHEEGLLATVDQQDSGTMIEIPLVPPINGELEGCSKPATVVIIKARLDRALKRTNDSALYCFVQLPFIASVYGYHPYNLVFALLSKEDLEMEIPDNPIPLRMPKLSNILSNRATEAYSKALQHDSGFEVLVRVDPEFEKSLASIRFIAGSFAPGDWYFYKELVRCELLTLAWRYRIMITFTSFSNKIDISHDGQYLRFDVDVVTDVDLILVLELTKLITRGLQQSDFLAAQQALVNNVVQQQSVTASDYTLDVIRNGCPIARLTEAVAFKYEEIGQKEESIVTLTVTTFLSMESYRDLLETGGKKFGTLCTMEGDLETAQECSSSCSDERSSSEEFVLPLTTSTAERSPNVCLETVWFGSENMMAYSFENEWNAATILQKLQPLVQGIEKYSTSLFQKIEEPLVPGTGKDITLLKADKVVGLIGGCGVSMKDLHDMFSRAFQSQQLTRRLSTLDGWKERSMLIIHGLRRTTTNPVPHNDPIANLAKLNYNHFMVSPNEYIIDIIRAAYPRTGVMTSMVSRFDQLHKLLVVRAFPITSMGNPNGSKGVWRIPGNYVFGTEELWGLEGTMFPDEPQT